MAATIDPQTGRVVVVTCATRIAPGAVLVLDTRSGRLVVLSDAMVHATDPRRWIPSGLRRRLPFIPPPVSTMRSIPTAVSLLGVTRS